MVQLPKVREFSSARNPWSQAVLLVGGNKAGRWSKWYDEAIPLAEEAVADWLISEAQRREKEK
jgi:hypothetical protein